MAVFFRYLTADERRKLLATIKGTTGPEAARDHAALRVLLLTGIRVGELMALTVAAVLRAMETDLFFIAGADRKGGRSDGKSGKRKVPDFERAMTADLRDALRDLLAARALITPGEEQAGAVMVSRFGPQRGQGMTVRAFQMRCSTWAKAAGIDARFSPHWLRHTRGKDLLASSTSRDPLGVVQAALGHASRNSTGIYTQPDKEELHAAARAADRLAMGRMGRRAARRVHVAAGVAQGGAA